LKNGIANYGVVINLLKANMHVNDQTAHEIIGLLEVVGAVYPLHCDREQKELPQQVLIPARLEQVDVNYIREAIMPSSLEPCVHSSWSIIMPHIPYISARSFSYRISMRQAVIHFICTRLPSLHIRK